MKSLFALIFAVLFLTACKTNRTDYVQIYREDGLPMWVGEVFSDPRGYWAGYNDEKGYYASGEAKYKDKSAATLAAELDAKRKLLNFLSGRGKTSLKNTSLTGVQRVDHFISDDGTVYILLFISEKNMGKNLANK